MKYKETSPVVHAAYYFIKSTRVAQGKKMVTKNGTKITRAWIAKTRSRKIATLLAHIEKQLSETEIDV